MYTFGAMNFNKNQHKLITYCLFLFLISALVGLLIRLNFVLPISNFLYANFLQGHSHIAFLGWGYLTALLLIITIFSAKKNNDVKKVYKTSFLILAISIALMLISFLLSGYKIVSIMLLAIFGVVSYVPSVALLKNRNEKTIAVKFIKTGIIYYLLSSLATWLIPYVIVSTGKTDLYYNTVYFYLHFLYNGFFVFVIFGIIFKLFETSLNLVSEHIKASFFWLLNMACILTYFLSVLWSSENRVLNIIGGIGAVLQLIAIGYLYPMATLIVRNNKLIKVEKVVFTAGVVAFFIKVVMQLFSALPYFVTKSIELKPFFIIGYLHLFTLGFMSALLLFILSKTRLINLKTYLGKWGVYLLLLGIVVTEMVLFGKGFLVIFEVNLLTNYAQLLLGFSIFMVLGVLLLVVNQFVKPSVG